MQDSSSSGHASSTQINLSASVSGSLCPLYLLDSSVSLHMTPSATYLTRCSSAPPITRVRIADDTPLPVSSIGHLTTGSFSVPSISHVPHLSMSLMFVSQLNNFNCQVIFDCTSCRVQDCIRVVIGIGRCHSGVNALESLCLSPSPTPSLHCHATILDFHHWYHRLGNLCPHLSSLVSRGSLGALS